VIPSDLYCPKCSRIWDKEECEFCGYVSEEYIKNTPRRSRKKKIEEEEGGKK
jgi:rRNA maturation endonuclease Nob1